MLNMFGISHSVDFTSSCSRSAEKFTSLIKRNISFSLFLSRSLSFWLLAKIKISILDDRIYWRLVLWIFNEYHSSWFSSNIVEHFHSSFPFFSFFPKLLIVRFLIRNTCLKSFWQMEDPMLKIQSTYAGRTDKGRPDGGGGFGPLVWSGGYELDGPGCGYSGGYFCQPSERASRTRLWPECNQETPHTSSLWSGTPANCSSSVYSSYPTYKEESTLPSLPYSTPLLSDQTGAFCQFPLQTTSSGRWKVCLCILKPKWLKLLGFFRIAFDFPRSPSQTRIASADKFFPVGIFAVVFISPSQLFFHSGLVFVFPADSIRLRWLDDSFTFFHNQRFNRSPLIADNRLLFHLFIFFAWSQSIKSTQPTRPTQSSESFESDESNKSVQSTLFDARTSSIVAIDRLCLLFPSFIYYAFFTRIFRLCKSRPPNERESPHQQPTSSWSQKTKTLFQTADTWTRKRVSFQSIRDQTKKIWIGSCPHPDGTPSKNLVPKPSDEEKKDKSEARRTKICLICCSQWRISFHLRCTILKIIHFLLLFHLLILANVFLIYLDASSSSSSNLVQFNRLISFQISHPKCNHLSSVSSDFQSKSTSFCNWSTIVLK